MDLQLFATNRIFEHGRRLSVVVSSPASPTSGAPVRVGQMTGVALTDEGEGGNAATETTVDFGPAVYDLSVQAVNDAGNSAVAVGDQLFWTDGDTPAISKKDSGYFFGFALEAITSGSTSTINVLVVPTPGPGTADILAGVVGTDELADNALAASAAGRGKMATGFFDVATVLAKFAANSFTNANVDSLFAAEAFAADADSRGKFADGIWEAAKLAAAILSGTQMATVANANVIGGIPVLHRIDITAGANADTDVTLTHKTRVIDAWLVLTGAGVTSATLQVKNGANAITGAMAASGSDTALVRAATIDDAYHEIAAAGTLRVTGASGATQPAATVYVLGVRVA